MPSAVDQFLGKLHRTLSDYEERHPESAPADYRVVSVNEPYISQQLDNCVVIERIGQGAMSVVYKAKQDFTDRIVAIKMLRAQLCCDTSNVRRFRREAKAIARLSHQNLLNVYSVGTTNTGQPFIVMDYVEGKSLGEIIAAEGQITWQRTAAIFLQVCDAMQHAHANRIIHRDLKPDNIMLVSNTAGTDYVKVVDFGIVKITDESQALSQRLTKTGEVWGSPVYMSPEQCMGHELDHRSDIYSVGTVLYECLTGKQLFEAKQITQLVMMQLQNKPQPFATIRPDLDIPAWLEKIAMKALEKQPADRFASMEEMKRALEKGLLSNKDTADAVLKPPQPMKTSSSLQAEQLISEIDSARRAYQSREDPFIGKMIGGKFQVESLIGDGGMSIVYRAMQQGINRPVAIKLLRDELCDDESNVRRFQRESKAVSQLTHPNLVGIYDVGTAYTGQPYMVMEYLQGNSLAEVLETEGKMSIERALPIFVQVCDVMQYAHSKGFVHRDLKPHNVMLVKIGERRDYVKVVDFGIVKLDEQRQALSQKLTAAGEICGSPIYMSPEQVLDEEVDARSDIYSFGIVMYECLTGRPAFGGKKITDVLNKHVNVAPPAFSESAPELVVPPVLEGIIFKTLEKRPSARFQSMLELKQALSSMLKRMQIDSAAGMSKSIAQGINTVPVLNTVSSGLKAAPPEETRKKGTVVMIALAAMLVGATIAAAAFFYLANQKQQEKSQDKPHDKPIVQQPVIQRKPDSLPLNKAVKVPIHRPTEVIFEPRTQKPTRKTRGNPKRAASTLELFDATRDANLPQHRPSEQSDPYHGAP